MKSILVGVDGSKESRDAVQFATDMAKEAGAKVVLVGVVWMPGGLGAPELNVSMTRAEEDERRRLASELDKIALDASASSGVPVETTVAAGPPAQTLARLAADEDVAQIVVGHRDRNAVRRLLLGSVADKVIELTPKPVTVVH